MTTSPRCWPPRAGRLAAGEVLVVAHKVVSKAEGALRRLADVGPSARAVELAEPGQGPAAVQVVLDETEAVRAEHGVLIGRTRHGFVCANAGGRRLGRGPGRRRRDPAARDPTPPARALRAALPGRPAVVVTDSSFGRAWRHGQCDVAIGLAGLAALEDWRGHRDADGRALRATWIAVADEAAAARTSSAPRTGASPRRSSPASRPTSPTTTVPARRRSLRPRVEDLFR